MGERAVWRVDDRNEHRPRTIGSGLQRPEPVLGEIAHQKEKSHAYTRERCRRLARDLRSRCADHRQRMAAEADANRINGKFELFCLHLSIGRLDESDAGMEWRRY